MSSRREELTRIAARLFAERGYPGTSLADLADALGMQKPSLYHHIASKEDLLWEVAWEGAEAFHAGLDAVPGDAAGDRAHPPGAAGASRRRRRPARHRDRLRARVALPRGRAPRPLHRGAPPLRGTHSRALPRRGRGQRAAHRSRCRDRRAALPVCGQLGLHVAPPGLEHRPARRPALCARCSTACAATRLRTERARTARGSVHVPSGSSSSISAISCARAAIGRARSRSSGVSLIVRCGITSSNAPS